MRRWDLTETDEVDPANTPALTKREEEETTLSVGWAPGQGLALVASLSEEEEFDDTGTLTGETTITAIALAWLF